MLKTNGHYYAIPNGDLVPFGTPGALPSVTTILDVRNKPGLIDWKLSVGREEVKRRSDEATTKGTAVHKAIENFIIDGEYPAKDFPHMDYFAGFMRWFEDNDVTHCQPEVFVFDEYYGYAGRTDLICKVNGEDYIIDFKTSKQLDKGMGLQLAAYAQALATPITSYKCGVVQLTDKTKRGFRFAEFNEAGEFDVFLAHLEIYRWLEKHTPIPAPEWSGVGPIKRG